MPPDSMLATIAELPRRAPGDRRPGRGRAARLPGRHRRRPPPGPAPGRRAAACATTRSTRCTATSTRSGAAPTGTGWALRPAGPRRRGVLRAPAGAGHRVRRGRPAVRGRSRSPASAARPSNGSSIDRNSLVFSYHHQVLVEARADVRGLVAGLAQRPPARARAAGAVPGRRAGAALPRRPSTRCWRPVLCTARQHRRLLRPGAGARPTSWPGWRAGSGSPSTRTGRRAGSGRSSPRPPASSAGGARPRGWPPTSPSTSGRTPRSPRPEGCRGRGSPARRCPAATRRTSPWSCGCRTPARRPGPHPRRHRGQQAGPRPPRRCGWRVGDRVDRGSGRDVRRGSPSSARTAS